MNLKIISLLSLGCFASTSAYAAPRTASARARFVAIDSKAQSLINRTAKLYRDAKTLYIEFKTIEKNAEGDVNQTPKSLLAFQAPDKLHLDVRMNEIKQLIINGKQKITLYNAKVTGAPNDQYIRKSLGNADIAQLISNELYEWQMWFGYLSLWQEGDARLGTEETNIFPGQAKLRTTLKIIGTQPFEGQMCDLVRYTQANLEGGAQQQTFWLSRKDGRLMRFQSNNSFHNKMVESQDFQLTKQQIGGRLDSKIFVFTPPPDATLEKE